MKNYIKLAVLGFLLGGCAAHPVTFASSNAELQALAEPFYQKFPQASRHVALQWTRINHNGFEKPTVVAICYHGRAPLVLLHAARIDPNNTAKVQVIVWHELGHCALGLRHFDGEYDLMNTYLSPAHPQDREMLLNILFHRI